MGFGAKSTAGETGKGSVTLSSAGPRPNGDRRSVLVARRSAVGDPAPMHYASRTRTRTRTDALAPTPTATSPLTTCNSPHIFPTPAPTTTIRARSSRVVVERTGSVRGDGCRLETRRNDSVIACDILAV